MLQNIKRILLLFLASDVAQQGFLVQSCPAKGLGRNLRADIWQIVRQKYWQSKNIFAKGYFANKTKVNQVGHFFVCSQTSYQFQVILQWLSHNSLKNFEWSLCVSPFDCLRVCVCVYGCVCLCLTCIVSATTVWRTCPATRSRLTPASNFSVVPPGAWKLPSWPLQYNFFEITQHFIIFESLSLSPADNVDQLNFKIRLARLIAQL